MRIAQKILISAIIILSFFSCRGQDTLLGNTASKNLVNKLLFLYQNAQGKDSVESKKQFFKLFPDNFEAFNSIYGYNKNPTPLYDVYDKHLALFCNLVNDENETQYYQKLIKLGINGYWDADAVNYLQDCTLSHLRKKLKEFVKELQRLDNINIRSFFKFLFDGPHPDDKEVRKEFDEIYENLSKCDKAIAKLLKEEYFRLLQNTKD